MPRRAVLAIVVAAAAVVAAAGLVEAGRMSADGGTARYESGRVAGYAAGLREGRAEGLQDGRALQEIRSLPTDSRSAARAAFDAGYAAGANDAFGDYDGGWSLGVPYVVTLSPGSGGIAYRIANREALARGVDYRLCPRSRRLCRRPPR
jgi:hypothetical protein